MSSSNGTTDNGSPRVTLHGLDNCDTCRKARKWLERFGIAYTFIDYRQQRPSPETLVDWAQQAGGFDALVNKSSTTWRQLPQARRSPGSAAEWTLLLREHTALIKRPVVVTDDVVLSQGFTDSGFKARFGITK